MPDFQKKAKILYIRKILMESTDKDHPISVNNIIKALSAYGIDAERKSVYSDIELLKQFGDPIVTLRRRENEYYVAENVFTPQEAEIIWDSVCVSNYIDNKSLQSIKQKLECLAGQYRKKQLHNRVYVTGKSLKQTGLFRINLNMIHTAIASRKRLAFDYPHLILSEKANRKAKEHFKVNPFNVSCVNGAYILIAGCDNIEGLTHFYIDKMENVKMSDEKATDIREFAGDIDFDISCYSQGLFSSYSETIASECVTLLCDRTMINEITGIFGEDVDIRYNSDTTFLVDIETEISEDFISWLFINSNYIRAISPDSLVDTIRNAAKDLYLSYN